MSTLAIELPARPATTAPPRREGEVPSPTAEVIRLPRCDGLINEYKTAA